MLFEDSVRDRFNVDEILSQLSTEYVKFDRSKIELTECKSSARAIEYRSDGNDMYLALEDDEALTFYTMSIAYAVDGSEEQALAYGNRSAVLFRISKYVQCLLDINRSLRGSCPEHVREKLCRRKEECLVQINKDRKSSDRIDARATDPIKVKNESVDKNTNHQWQKLCKFGNPLISNASSKIKLAFDAQWGRHMVATKDIEPGEILTSQKFFLLTPKTQFKNCSYCLSKCFALIPCPSCTQMMYCSDDCLAQAYNSYHQIECKLMAFKRMSNSDLKLEPLRMLLIGTNKQGANVQKLMKKLEIRDIFAEGIDPSNKPFVNDYLSVLSLCKNYNPLFLESYILLAVESVIMLERIAFFDRASDHQSEEVEQVNLNEEKLYTMMLFINHACARSLNAFNVGPFANWNENISPFGHGICVLNSFINHSCDPNAVWFIRNREHVIVAQRPIKRGNQIFVAYTGVFWNCPIEKRHAQLLLSHNFNCKCTACTNEWPVYTIERAPLVQFTAKNVKKAVQDLKIIMLPVLDGDINSLKNQAILQIIINACKWVYTNTKEPALTYTAECEECLWKFMMLLFDDFSQEHLTKIKSHVVVILEAVMNCVLKSYIVSS